MVEGTDDRGLSLFEAARRLRIPFVRELEPTDGSVVVDNLRFHYLEWGDADRPTVVFLHGVAQQAHSWDFISLTLADRYHVLALDARGHGDSQWSPTGDYSLDALQRDLDGFVEALSLAPFTLVGHSMGGRSAYVFASRRPEKVKALVIVDTGPERVRPGGDRIRQFMSLPDLLDSYEEFALRVQGYTGRELWQVRGSLKHSIRQLPDGKWTWKYDKVIRSPDYRPQTWSTEELWQSLSKVQCPTLVIRGGKSDVFSPEVMERMLQVIPRATSAVVPGAGHLVAGDNPRGFLAAVTPFLEGVA